MDIDVATSRLALVLIIAQAPLLLCLVLNCSTNYLLITIYYTGSLIITQSP